MAEHHRVGYHALSNQQKFFKIPIIVLSSLNSVFSVGGSSYIQDQTVVSTVTSLLSLICGCLASIELYLALQRRSDSELLSYRQFYVLSLKISTLLKLDREHRQGEPEQVLAEMINSYRECFEGALANGLEEKDRLVELKEIETPLN